MKTIINAVVFSVLVTFLTSTLDAQEAPVDAVETEVSDSNAKEMNAELRKLVLKPGQKIEAARVDELRHAISKHPLRLYFNTLAVAEFRRANFAEAIVAVKKSMELSPNRLDLPAPLPIDLAILSMSHLHLGNGEEAIKYYKLMNQTMMFDPFKRNKECISFAGEVNKRLGSPKQFATASEMTAKAKQLDVLSRELENTIQQHGENHRETIRIRHQMVSALLDAKVNDKALKLAEENFDASLDSLSLQEDSQLFNQTAGVLAWLLLKQGFVDEAIDVRRQSSEFCVEKLGEDAAIVFDNKMQYATFLGFGNEKQRDQAIDLADSIHDKLKYDGAPNVIKSNRISWRFKNKRYEEVATIGPDVIDDFVNRNLPVMAGLTFDVMLKSAEASKSEVDLLPISKKVQAAFLKKFGKQSKELCAFELGGLPKAQALAGSYQAAIDTIKFAQKRYSEENDKEYDFLNQGTSLALLCDCYFKLGETDNAIKYGTQCLNLFEKQIEVSHPMTVEFLERIEAVTDRMEGDNALKNKIAAIRNQQQQRSAAAGEQKQKLEREVELAENGYKGQAKANKGMHFQSASRLQNAYLRMGENSKALEVAKAEQAKAIELAGVESPDALNANNNLVLIRKLTQSPVAAVFCRQSFIDQAVSELGKDHSAVGTARAALAMTLRNLKDKSGSFTLLESLVAKLETDQPKSDFCLKRTAQLADYYYQSGVYDRAMQLYERKCFEKYTGQNRAGVMSRLGEIYLMNRRLEDATVKFRDAHTEMVNVAGEQNGPALDNLRLMGQEQSFAGELVEAQKAFEKVIALSGSKPELQQLKIMTKLNLTPVLFQLDKSDEATEMMKGVLADAEAKYGKRGQETIQYRQQLFGIATRYLAPENQFAQQLMGNFVDDVKGDPGTQ